ncbi:conserved protein of unknown function [Pseudomonas marincola]|uniref:Uncharacterized protein n=1 Tax=Pseudomonas marincola TaxID=437900 RepID=A0A653E6Q7_9PSED|nr:conserved protein of unknown function [Pseudomonas marincola]
MAKQTSGAKYSNFHSVSLLTKQQGNVQLLSMSNRTPGRHHREALACS